MMSTQFKGISGRSMNTEEINAMATIEDNKLIYTWIPDHTGKHADDGVMLLAYSPVLHKAIYCLCEGKRSTGKDQLILPAAWWGVEMLIETYLSFIGENGTRCTNIIYTGRFILD